VTRERPQLHSYPAPPGINAVNEIAALVRSSMPNAIVAYAGASWPPRAFEDAKAAAQEVTEGREWWWWWRVLRYRTRSRLPHARCT
jgi:hypothetical protein